ncbi:hypothetical protein PCANC_28727 [Puccinia coronata f. sp. avenae]|uniref:Uncharacterized protein n=1 Tax=Puccinia coronata f. sp. avenae TaxID=200324 RepID=A0A2N5RZ38_9BASI|nr:hypothetical protein PCANC_28727 [Puccinia coronata f. sp. avenae]
MLAIQVGLPNQLLAGGDWLQSNLLDRPIQLAGMGFGKTVPVQLLVKHGCSRTSQPSVFDQSMPAGLYRLQPPAARSVAATDVTSVYQTDVTSAAPTDTLCLCSNVSVGPADIKSVWATDVTSVASGRRYRGGL